MAVPFSYLRSIPWQNVESRVGLTIAGGWLSALVEKVYYYLTEKQQAQYLIEKLCGIYQLLS